MESNIPYHLWQIFARDTVNNESSIWCNAAQLFTCENLYTGGSTYGYAIEGGAGEEQFYNNPTYNGNECSVSYQSTNFLATEDAYWYGHYLGKSLNGDESSVYATPGTWMNMTYSSSGLQFDATNAARITSFTEAISTQSRDFLPDSTDTEDNLQVSYTTLMGNNISLAYNDYCMFTYNINNPTSSPVTDTFCIALSSPISTGNYPSDGLQQITVPEDGSNSYSVRCFCPTMGGSWTIYPALDMSGQLHYCSRSPSIRPSIFSRTIHFCRDRQMVISRTFSVISGSIQNPQYAARERRCWCNVSLFNMDPGTVCQQLLFHLCPALQQNRCRDRLRDP